MSNHFLSCDWGTTNFRLRLVTRDSCEVLAEATADSGVSNLAKAWGEKGGGDEAARVDFYTEVLRKAVEELKQTTEVSLEAMPVVISGMASSTLGLVNLPYAALPVPVDGSGFRTHIIEPSPAFGHPILLISGLRSDDDVIRGEETQLIGCLTPEMESYTGDQLVIHPGTHSKHIVIAGGQITGFATFMTGELFKLFSTHGILRDNVTINPFSASAVGPFEQGVREAGDNPLLHAAFRVRTNDLFGRWSKEENYHYLSGLLIGTELQSLAGRKERCYLCSGPSLHEQYATAIKLLGLDTQVHILSPEWEEGAVVRGQAKVLKTTPFSGS
jgi:2-dehydro-3-deoxygalactonokinase